jgi:hypothetical protein
MHISQHQGHTKTKNKVRYKSPNVVKKHSFQNLREKIGTTDNDESALAIVETIFGLAIVETIFFSFFSFGS